ncbi:hypothetical protein [Pseudomonas sp. D1HM]|uniref:hypothetical protein n=1 Tax=Pseudomonas sp. D1HM TaxID=1784816 RepID=UPI001C4EDCD4|nr:hypothetical protein [Pseudomonas sp. D1HM]
MKRHMLAILVSISSLTAAADDTVTMPGPAIYSCTQWSDSAANSLRTPLAMWLFGFVSGSNVRTAPNNLQADIYDNGKALAFADSYCKSNPNHHMSQLALAMVEKFGGPKAKHEWSE